MASLPRTHARDEQSSVSRSDVGMVLVKSIARWKVFECFRHQEPVGEGPTYAMHCDEYNRIVKEKGWFRIGWLSADVFCPVCKPEVDKDE